MAIGRPRPALPRELAEADSTAIGHARRMAGPLPKPTIDIPVDCVERMQPRVISPSFALRRSALMTLTLAVGLLLAACGSNGTSEPAGSDEPEGTTVSVVDGAVTITAANLEFDASVIEATAGEAFTITLVNNDSAPHNLSIYTEDGGEQVVLGATAEGGQTVEIDVSALEAGEYFFKCDIHPDMNGSVVVGA